MKILSFDLFLEARFSNLVKIKTDAKSDIEKSIKKSQESEFDFSKNLVKFITLNTRVNNKKVRMEIKWNHDANHNLFTRISNRTSFKSVNEFNDYFKKLINKFFPSEVGKDIFGDGLYSIYDREHNMTIVFYIDTDDFLINDVYEIKIVTILTGERYNKNTQKILYN